MTDAGDILEELSSLLTRHGCIMAAKPEGLRAGAYHRPRPGGSDRHRESVKII